MLRVWNGPFQVGAHNSDFTGEAFGELEQEVQAFTAIARQHAGGEQHVKMRRTV